MSLLDNMTERGLEDLYVDLKAITKERDEFYRLYLAKKEELERAILGLKKEISKSMAAENKCVVMRDENKLAEKLRFVEENKKLKVGVSEFSKALQNIGLKLVQMGIETRHLLVENKNDGQK